LKLQNKFGAAFLLLRVLSAAHAGPGGVVLGGDKVLLSVLSLARSVHKCVQTAIWRKGALLARVQVARVHVQPGAEHAHPPLLNHRARSSNVAHQGGGRHDNNEADEVGDCVIVTNV